MCKTYKSFLFTFPPLNSVIVDYIFIIYNQFTKFIYISIYSIFIFLFYFDKYLFFIVFLLFLFISNDFTFLLDTDLYFFEEIYSNLGNLIKLPKLFKSLLILFKFSLMFSISLFIFLSICL